MLLGVFCAGEPCFTHVCDLIGETWPEYTAVSTTGGELGSTVGCMEFAEHSLAE